MNAAPALGGTASVLGIKRVNFMFFLCLCFLGEGPYGIDEDIKTPKICFYFHVHPIGSCLHQFQVIMDTFRPEPLFFECDKEMCGVNGIGNAVFVHRERSISCILLCSE